MSSEVSCPGLKVRGGSMSLDEFGGAVAGLKVRGGPMRVCQKQLWLSERIRHLRCLPPSVARIMPSIGLRSFCGVGNS